MKDSIRLQSKHQRKMLLKDIYLGVVPFIFGISAQRNDIAEFSRSKLKLNYRMQQADARYIKLWHCTMYAMKWLPIIGAGMQPAVTLQC